MQKETPYIVVLRYTPEAGAREGLITFATYDSRNGFEKSREAFLSETHQEVVAEGVSREEATDMVAETPLRSRIRAVLAVATDEKTRKVDYDLLERGLLQVYLAGNFREARSTP